MKDVLLKSLSAQKEQDFTQSREFPSSILNYSEDSPASISSEDSPAPISSEDSPAPISSEDSPAPISFQPLQSSQSLSLNPSSKESYEIKNDSQDAFEILQLFETNPEYYNIYKEIISKKFSGEEHESNFLEKLKYLINQKKIKLSFDDVKLACLNGHYDFVKMFMSCISWDEKFFQFGCDSTGKTFIHHLAIKDLTDYDQDLLKKIVDLLLENQIDINKKDSLGKTALNYTILKKNLGLFKILISKNIDRRDTSNQGRACMVGDPNDNDSNLMLTTLGIVLRSKDYDKLYIYKEFLIPLLMSGVLISKVDVTDQAQIKKNHFEIVVDFFNSCSTEDKEYLSYITKGILSNPLNIPTIAFLANPDMSDEEIEKKISFSKSFFKVLKQADIKGIQSSEIKKMLQDELDIALIYHNRSFNGLRKKSLKVELSSSIDSDLSSKSRFFVHPNGILIDTDEERYDRVFRYATEICFKQNNFFMASRLMDCGCDLNYAVLRNDNNQVISFAEALRVNFMSQIIQYSKSKSLNDYELKFKKLELLISLLNLVDKGFNLYLISDQDEDLTKFTAVRASDSSLKTSGVGNDSKLTLTQPKKRDFFSLTNISKSYNAEKKNEKISNLFIQKKLAISSIRSHLEDFSLVFFSAIMKSLFVYTDNGIDDIAKIGIFKSPYKNNELETWLKQSREGDSAELTQKKNDFIEEIKKLELKKAEIISKICSEGLKLEISILMEKRSKKNFYKLETYYKDNKFDCKKLKMFFSKLKFNENYFFGGSEIIFDFKFSENGVNYDFQEIAENIQKDSKALSEDLLFNTVYNYKTLTLMEGIYGQRIFINSDEHKAITKEVKELTDEYFLLSCKARSLFEENISSLFSEEEAFIDKQESLKVKKTIGDESQESEKILSILSETTHDYPFAVRSQKLDIEESFQPVQEDSLKSETLKKLLMAINGLEIIEIEKYTNTEKLIIENLNDFTRGCCFLISYEQELAKAFEIQNECKKQEIIDSYKEFCEVKKFKVNLSELNLFKHYFHLKLDEFVNKIYQNEELRYSLYEIKSNIYFILALCHASKQKDLRQVKNDIEYCYGLGHATDSSKSEIVKSIFILERLSDIYSQPQKHFPDENFGILDWIDDLHQQQENKAAKKTEIEYFFKESKIEDSRYLSSLVKELACSEKSDIEPINRINKAVHEFCLLYCHFISEIYHVRNEEFGPAKGVYSNNLEIMKNLQSFLKTSDSKDPKVFFKFLAKEEKLLNLFGELGSSDFVRSKDESLDSLYCLSDILTKCKFKKNNIEEDLDYESDESLRYKNLINGFFDNSLIKISDLKKQNVEILKNSMKSERESVQGPAHHQRLVRVQPGNFNEV